MGSCYLSWFPSSRFCNGDKFWGGIILFMILLFLSWAALFIWTKSEFVADFSWYSTMSPWWSLGISCGILLFMSWMVFIQNWNSSDFWLFAAMIATATIAYITICTFLVLLAWNLEKMYNDEPMFSWVIVVIPMIVFEAYAFIACTILSIFICMKD